MGTFTNSEDHDEMWHNAAFHQDLHCLTNSEDFDEMQHNAAFHQGLHCLLRLMQSSGTEIHNNGETTTCDPLKYIMGNPNLIAFICMGKSIRILGANRIFSSSVNIL